MSDYDDLPLFSLEANEGEAAEPDRPELLTIKLFKQAVLETAQDQDDGLLESFASHVLPKLMRQLVGATAKGGQFTEGRLLAPY